MKKTFILLTIALSGMASFGQGTMSSTTPREPFILVKNNPATPVKNQANSGTCWSFSTTSFLESQLINEQLGTFDMSEMFTVRNMYIEKAKNYMRRLGHAQFGEGGLGHDVIRSVATYGAMPESAYPGLTAGQKEIDHTKLIMELSTYLNNLLKKSKPLPQDWLVGYNRILDAYMGPMPTEFIYNGKSYTPKTFAADVMKFNPNDYVNLTSFTDHPYYQPFIIQVPDNFSDGAYYNLPLEEMIDAVTTAVTKGYTVLWDADVSNYGFQQKSGLALFLDPALTAAPTNLNADYPEATWDASKRQSLYEDLVTQDDHLMHITGVEKTASGKTFFVVKNSWGNVGPYAGYVNVSQPYFAINTISLVVPKASLKNSLLEKLKIK